MFLSFTERQIINYVFDKYKLNNVMQQMIFLKGTVHLNNLSLFTCHVKQVWVLGPPHFVQTGFVKLIDQFIVKKKKKIK